MYTCIGNMSYAGQLLNYGVLLEKKSSDYYGNQWSIDSGFPWQSVVTLQPIATTTVNIEMFTWNLFGSIFMWKIIL